MCCGVIIDEDVAESSHRRRGGRLGLAGGVRGRDVGLGRGNAGRSGLGRGGAGGSGLGQRVRSVVNQAMVGEMVREAAGRTTGMHAAAATMHAVDAGLDLRGQGVALIR